MSDKIGGEPCRPTIPRIVFVLPAYNEEANIGGLLDEIRVTLAEASLPYRVVVVDDGSRDRTAPILDEWAVRMPLEIERHASNQGLGPAILHGLAAAMRSAGDDDVVVTMDADQTHSPDLALKMYGRVRNGADVVIASRYRRDSLVSGVPVARRLTSWLASLVFRVLFPIRGVRDYSSGFRAFRASALKRAFLKYGERLIESRDFSCTIELLLKLRRLAIRFEETPIVLTYERKAGRSKMPAGRTALRTLSLIVRRGR
jgi:dolichol-phosphate mannosyltransferase